jgi:hypothetical protein
MTRNLAAGHGVTRNGCLTGSKCCSTDIPRRAIGGFPWLLPGPSARRGLPTNGPSLFRGQAFAEARLILSQLPKTATNRPAIQLPGWEDRQTLQFPTRPQWSGEGW